jgi:hypothetical protein
LKKNHEAEEKANGKVGSFKKYGRYFSGSTTLNEQPIPEEDDV